MHIYSEWKWFPNERTSVPDWFSFVQLNIPTIGRSPFSTSPFCRDLIALPRFYVHFVSWPNYAYELYAWSACNSRSVKPHIQTKWVLNTRLACFVMRNATRTYIKYSIFSLFFSLVSMFVSTFVLCGFIKFILSSTYCVRNVNAALVMLDGRCNPLIISCHNFLLITSTRPPRAITKL